jgi:hypothetical protein
MEVTTYRGHANVWGASGWVDFRIAATPTSPPWCGAPTNSAAWSRSTTPRRSPGCIGCDWEYAVPDEADALEAWQGPWWLRNWESLARYDRLLAGGAA